MQNNKITKALSRSYNVNRVIIEKLDELCNTTPGVPKWVYTTVSLLSVGASGAAFVAEIAAKLSGASAATIMSYLASVGEFVAPILAKVGITLTLSASVLGILSIIVCAIAVVLLSAGVAMLITWLVGKAKDFFVRRKTYVYSNASDNLKSLNRACMVTATSENASKGVIADIAITTFNAYSSLGAVMKPSTLELTNVESGSPFSLLGEFANEAHESLVGLFKVIHLGVDENHELERHVGDIITPCTGRWKSSILSGEIKY